MDILVYALLKKKIADEIAGITEFDYEVVNQLPSTGEKGVIYLVPYSSTSGNSYREWIYVNDAFEEIGVQDSEQWTFTLSDNTQVIKNVVVD